MTLTLKRMREIVARANRRNRKAAVRRAVPKARKMGLCAKVFGDGMCLCTLRTGHWQPGCAQNMAL